MTRLADRGQSEVLGFVFVFSLIVTTVAIISAVGYVELGEVRTQEQVNNAERGFELLVDDVNALTRREAPSRETRFALSGGSLSEGAPTTVTISSSAVDGAETFNRTYQVRPLVYRHGDSWIRLVNGAIVRGRDTGVMVRPPSMVLTPDHTVIPIVDISMQPSQVDQDSSVLIRTTRLGNASGATRLSEPQNVTVNVTSPHAAVWERYFEGHEHVTCTRANQTASCEFSTQRVSVIVVRIRATVNT